MAKRTYLPTMFKLVERLARYLLANTDVISKNVTPQQLSIITAGLTAINAILALKQAIDGE